MRLKAEDITVDLASMSLLCGNDPVPVEPLVLRLIAHLVQHRDRVVSKAELLDALWEGRVVSDSALTRAISLARSALRTPRVGNPIRSVYGVGYQLADRRLRPEDRLGGSSQPGRRTVGGHLFVGRSSEVLALTMALDAAETGAGSLHLVSGEPGIGKTRLLDRLIDEGQARGFRIWVGRCSEAGGAPAFWPWMQVFRQEVRTDELTDHDLDDSLRTRLQDLLWFRDDSDPETPQHGTTPGNRFILLDAMSQFLIARARLGPTVLVLDDVHRADRESLSLLRLLAFEVRRLPLVVSAAFRPAELGMQPQLAASVAQIAAVSDGVRHELVGLSPDEVVDVLRSRDQGTSRAAHLQSHSGGNPLFLHHLISIESGTPKRPAAPQQPLPDLLRDAIELHLQHLSSSTLDLLSRAAVIGSEFDVSLLQELSGSEEEVHAALEEAVRSSILVRSSSAEHERYRFSHVLIRDRLYERTPTLQRARYHSTLATRLEAAGSRRHLSEIAHHRRAAVPAEGLEGATVATLRAARDAVARFAYHEAASLYAAAASLLDSDAGDREAAGECYADLAEALVRAGDRAGAWRACGQAVEVAREFDLPSLLAKAALALSPGVLSIETSLYDQRHVDLLSEAIGANSARGSALQAKLLSRLTSALYWSDKQDERQIASQRALELAKGTRNPEALADALYARHSALWGPDSLKARLGIARRLVRIADDLDDRESRIIYRSTLITDLAEAGDTGSMAAEVAQFQADATQLRQPESIWLAPMFQATLKLMGGDFRSAEVLNSELLDLGTRVESEDAANCWAAQTILRRFELGEGVAVVETLLAHAAEHPNVLNLFRTAPAWAAAELGLTHEARGFLEPYAATAFLSVPRDMNWLGSLVVLSMASAELGDETACAQLLALIEPYADRFALLGYCAVGFGSVAAHLGRLAAAVGRTSDAWHYFELGHQANAAAGAEPWIARGLYGKGVAQLAEGEPGAASVNLESARRIADRLGMSHLSQRCAAALP